MGDWQGTLTTVAKNGKKKTTPAVAQVIALGKGTYQANILPEFDKRCPPIATLEGKIAGGAATFTDGAWTATNDSLKFTGKTNEKNARTFELKKVVRLSHSLGEKPPKSAVVLFDGTNLDAWQKTDGKPATWKLENGVMISGSKAGTILTKQKFDSFLLHVEFRLPFEPDNRGQARGNSGVYLRERYEVQVLDSYGLPGYYNECGGFYKISAPRVNACAPPLQWQTYDIMFRAPRLDENGKVVRPARAGVFHNGTMIQKDTDLPIVTGGGRGAIGAPGGIMLQDHGHSVQYRNIWLLELDEIEGERP